MTSTGASNLYEVQVRGPGGASWRILCRAVDPESAVGIVRARGHEVVGVRVAEPPAKGAGRLKRATCQSCDYSLAKLPEGDAGEVRCPECGWVNIPEPVNRSSAAAVLYDRRARRSRWALILVLAGVVAVFVVLSVVR